MNYTIKYSKELYHHGVKGMKWGIRKADYNTAGAKSSDIYRRIGELEKQETLSKLQNTKDYRTNKKAFKQDLKSQKKAKTITKAEYTAKKREGVKAAKDVFRKNNNAIHSNFNKAYYDIIKSGEIASARNRNTLAKALDWSGQASTQINYNESKLNKAEARRNEFAQDYAMRSYKPKKR